MRPETAPSNPLNTPDLETERLRLRRFDEEDLDDLFAIYADEATNTFLPWFPVKSLEEARAVFEERYASVYRQPRGYAYAVCLKDGGAPIGYVHASLGESHDLGYGLRSSFWHQGIATEACAVILERLRADGVPFVTATHDVQNPRSGEVMKRLGMSYRYTYEEQWQPKNRTVMFRLYQLDLDGNDARTYLRYWNDALARFVEPGV